MIPQLVACSIAALTVTAMVVPIGTCPFADTPCIRGGEVARHLDHVDSAAAGRGRGRVDVNASRNLTLWESRKVDPWSCGGT